MSKERVNHFFINFRVWIFRYRSALVILASLALITLLIHFFGWWETLGILFLKFGLGAKVAGAKTFTQAMIKAGGKKAIAVATAGMLTKRHIIDLVSKFFAEHSIKRYKRNLTLVLKKKFDEIKHSTPVKKLRALGSMLLSVPMIYFFWTKVLGTAIQKFVYALVLPMATLLWNLILTGINFLGFIFQILMLNIFLDTLASYSWGKKIIALIDDIVHLVGSVLGPLNTLFGYIGLNPKAWLVKLSDRFNRWLESILDKGLSQIDKIQNKRDRHINAVEALSEKRYFYAQSKHDKQISYWKYTKKLFDQKVLRKKEWRESRIHREKRWKSERLNSRTAIRNNTLTKREKRKPLHLPFHKVNSYPENKLQNFRNRRL